MERNIYVDLAEIFLKITFVILIINVFPAVKKIDINKIMSDPP